MFIYGVFNVYIYGIHIFDLCRHLGGEDERGHQVGCVRHVPTRCQSLKVVISRSQNFESFFFFFSINQIEECYISQDQSQKLNYLRHPLPEDRFCEVPNYSFELNVCLSVR